MVNRIRLSILKDTLYNGTLNNISFPYNGSHNFVFVDTTGVQYPDNTIDL